MSYCRPESRKTEFEDGSRSRVRGKTTGTQGSSPDLSPDFCSSCLDHGSASNLEVKQSRTANHCWCVIGFFIPTSQRPIYDPVATPRASGVIFFCRECFRL